MTGRITGGRLSVAAALATAMAIGLQACGGGTGGEAVDEDQDGFAAEEDCNDNDATVHPGADELCNGVDDDCDGTEDEDAVDAATWHADEDSDGYGDPDATRQACEQSSGTVADSTDCDDADADVHPGADELCNRADDDCDGTEDEDATDQATWFVDGDTDGYGDPDAARQACEQPPGTVTDSTDCDDSEGEVHPAADERCNGLDDNCDAVTDSDAVDRSTWYLDGDSDEYGDPLVSQIGCEQPAGYLADSTDCDDGAPDVNPGEVEICDNSVDEDCDGTADDGCAVRHCGDITVDTVWDASAPHVVTCDILVEGTSGPTLTVEDGALVMFEAGVRMIVGGWNTGTIVVEGTSAGVTFTSASPTPTPGIWQGLQIGLFDQGSTLTGLTIEYGGGNGLGTLYLYNSQPVLDGVTVRHSSRDGVNGVTAFPLIRNSTFSDNAEDGIYLDANSGLDRSASPTFSGNVLTRNGEYAMSVPADYAGELDSSSTFTGNATDRIRLLADTVATTQTWLGQDVPYFVDGDVLVEGVAAPVLTVGDGATVLFGPTVRMIVAGWDDGSLIIDGASTGVTFGSGAAVPAPGDWQGLQIGLFDQGSTLTGFTIEYGGGNGLGTLYLYNSQPVLDGVTVRHSSRDGVNGVT
ncbi:MAG: right-handed parallel beta-helix repeat-containing protein, partial [Deltaproteobacteria bacterium]|nr:right-handed parallel beta-helix repeat-containing protein [Deltaproteobacteria bacterium]